MHAKIKTTKNQRLIVAHEGFAYDKMSESKLMTAQIIDCFIGTLMHFANIRNIFGQNLSVCYSSLHQ